MFDHFPPLAKGAVFPAAEYRRMRRSAGLLSTAIGPGMAGVVTSGFAGVRPLKLPLQFYVMDVIANYKEMDPAVNGTWVERANAAFFGINNTNQINGMAKPARVVTLENPALRDNAMPIRIEYSYHQHLPNAEAGHPGLITLDANQVIGVNVVFAGLRFSAVPGTLNANDWTMIVSSGDLVIEQVGASTGKLDANAIVGHDVTVLGDFIVNGHTGITGTFGYPSSITMEHGLITAIVGRSVGIMSLAGTSPITASEVGGVYTVGMIQMAAANLLALAASMR